MINIQELANYFNKQENDKKYFYVWLEKVFFFKIDVRIAHHVFYSEPRLIRGYTLLTSSSVFDLNKHYIETLQLKHLNNPRMSKLEFFGYMGAFNTVYDGFYKKGYYNNIIPETNKFNVNIPPTLYTESNNDSLKTQFPLNLLNRANVTPDTHWKTEEQSMPLELYQTVRYVCELPFSATIESDNRTVEPVHLPAINLDCVTDSGRLGELDNVGTLYFKKEDLVRTLEACQKKKVKYPIDIRPDNMEDSLLTSSESESEIIDLGFDFEVTAAEDREYPTYNLEEILNQFGVDGLGGNPDFGTVVPEGGALSAYLEELGRNSESGATITGVPEGGALAASNFSVIDDLETIENKSTVSNETGEIALLYQEEFVLPKWLKEFFLTVENFFLEYNISTIFGLIFGWLKEFFLIVENFFLEYNILTIFGLIFRIYFYLKNCWYCSSVLVRIVFFLKRVLKKFK